jgi:hypothetical protein
MSNIGAACAVVAVLAMAGCSREPAPGAAYNAGAGTTWDTSPAVVPANLPVAVPATPAMNGDQQTVNGDQQTMNGDQQTGPSGDAPAASGCAQPAEYGYATPSYASRYGVRMVRPRVMEEQPRIYEERRVVRRHGRSTGRSIAIVAGGAGVGAAIGGIAGGGKGAAIGAIAGGSGGFAYDRLTHNR